MLRRHHRFFQSVQILRDSFLSGLAFYVAYGLRFHTDWLPVAPGRIPDNSPAVGLIVVMVWPVVAWVSKLYYSHRTRSLVVELFLVFKISVIAFLGLVTVTYFVHDVRYSRATLLLWTAFSFLFVSWARVSSRSALRRLRARGYNLRHVLLVGVDDLAHRVIETITRQSHLGLRVAGALAHDDDAGRVGDMVAGVEVLGTVSDITAQLKSCEIDQVIVALPIEKLSALKGLMETLSRETVDVRLVPDVFQYVTLCGSVEEFSGLPIINLQATPLMGWNLVFKRSFDVIVASLGLLLAAPLMLAIGAWIRLSSDGPCLFSQERVGLDGKRFRMHKFRTMRVDAEAGKQWTTAEDPRRTAFGTTLRRISLDELPQLWNVVRGDMSLVGPRPEQSAFTENFTREIPRYALRHKIKAGMTGWAQINGLRGDTCIKKRIELDLYYIENWSFFLDLKIVIRTVFGGFMSPNAY